MSSEELVELEYQADLHQHYEQLCELPGFVLLESRDQNVGRYDIVSAYPYEQIVINNDSADKQEKLAYLQCLLQPEPSRYQLPFQGGAIGYISYDLGADLMRVHAKPQPILSTQPLLNFGLYDWAIITDHYLKKAVLFAAHQQPSTKDHIKHVLSLWSAKQREKKFTLTNTFNALMKKEYYEYAFSEIKKALMQGRSYQVNFTQPYQAQYTGDDWAIYHQISMKNPVPFAAFLQFDNEAILSFSPERFLLHDAGNLLTSPIKGTIRRANNATEDESLKKMLLNSTKNRAENVMIVDLLRNDLAKVTQPGSVRVLELCSLQSYNSVHHLISHIEAKCQENINVFDLFLSCFPGGSITGAPKLEAMRIINELELFGRGVYCGSIVYFSRHGRFDSNIAIRTITATDNILHLAAGGGIVIDSDCEDEYRECYIKINAIINGLK